MKTHTYTYYLSSSTRDSGTIANALFNTKMQTLRENYVGYDLYVDNLTMDTDELASKNIVFRLTNINQIHSYNSINKSGSNVIATIINTNVTSSRTADVASSYQNPNAPIPISNLPEQMNVLVTTISNSTALDLTTNSNNWTLKLRIVAHLPDDMN